MRDINQLINDWYRRGNVGSSMEATATLAYYLVHRFEYAPEMVVCTLRHRMDEVSDEMQEAWKQFIAELNGEK